MKINITIFTYCHYEPILLFFISNGLYLKKKQHQFKTSELPLSLDLENKLLART